MHDDDSESFDDDASENQHIMQSKPKSLLTKKKSVFRSTVGEGDVHLKNKDLEKARRAYTKALEIEPHNNVVMLARAKCLTLLGKYNEANDDIDRVLKAMQDTAEDPLYFKALLQKGETLFAAGKFEFALMYFHRGYAKRPSMDEFRLGIQKAKQAIDDSLGNPTDSENARSQTPQRQSYSPIVTGSPASTAIHSSPRVQSGSMSRLQTNPVPTLNFDALKDIQSPISTHTAAESPRSVMSFRSAPDDQKLLRSSTARSSQNIEPQPLPNTVKALLTHRRNSDKTILGELYADKKFLESLKNDAVITKRTKQVSSRKKQPDAPTNGIDDIAQSGIDYLNRRTQFWREADNQKGSPERVVFSHRHNPPTNVSVFKSPPSNSKYSPYAEPLRSPSQKLSNTATPVPPSGPPPTMGARRPLSSRQNAIRPQTSHGLVRKSFDGSPIDSGKQATVYSSSSYQRHSVTPTLVTSSLSSFSEYSGSHKKKPQSQQQVNTSSGKPDVQQNGVDISSDSSSSLAEIREQMDEIQQVLAQCDPENAVQMCKQLLPRIADLDTERKNMLFADVYSLMGTAYSDLHKYELAVINHRKDLDIAIRYNYAEARLRALENLALTYETIRDYSASADAWQQYYDATDNSLTKLLALEALGKCCIHLMQYEEAIERYRQAMSLIQSPQIELPPPEYKRRHHRLQNAIAQVFCKANRIAEAVAAFEECVSLSRESNESIDQAQALSGLGNCYLLLARRLASGTGASELEPHNEERQRYIELSLSYQRQAAQLLL